MEPPRGRPWSGSGRREILPDTSVESLKVGSEEGGYRFNIRTTEGAGVKDPNASSEAREGVQEKVRKKFQPILAALVMEVSPPEAVTTAAAPDCRRNSGAASTISVVRGPAGSPDRRRAIIEQRERQFRRSPGSHAPQAPSARGTPPEEPLPRIVTSNMALKLLEPGRKPRKRRLPYAPRPPPATSL